MLLLAFSRVTMLRRSTLYLLILDGEFFIHTYFVMLTSLTSLVFCKIEAKILLIWINWWEWRIIHEVFSLKLYYVNSNPNCRRISLLFNWLFDSFHRLYMLATRIPRIAGDSTSPEGIDVASPRRGLRNLLNEGRQSIFLLGSHFLHHFPLEMVRLKIGKWKPHGDCNLNVD